MGAEKRRELEQPSLRVGRGRGLPEPRQNVGVQIQNWHYLPHGPLPVLPSPLAVRQRLRLPRLAIRAGDIPPADHESAVAVAPLAQFPLVVLRHVNPTSPAPLPIKWTTPFSAVLIASAGAVSESSTTATSAS